MTVIKHTNAAEVARRAVVLDLSDLQQQADRLIAGATAQANAITAAAQAEADRLVETADARGCAAGEARGLATGRAEGEEAGRREAVEAYGTRIDELVATWTEALGTWDRERQAMIVAAREDVLAFAMAMASKIVGRLIELDPTVIEHQLAETLACLSRPSDLTITINPADRELVDQVLPGLVEAVIGSRHAQIREDDRVGRGGCKVQTGRGAIDATIDTQIAHIVQTLLPAPPAASDTAVEDGERP